MSIELPEISNIYIDSDRLNFREKDGRTVFIILKDVVILEISGKMILTLSGTPDKTLIGNIGLEPKPLTISINPYGKVVVSDRV